MTEPAEAAETHGGLDPEALGAMSYAELRSALKDAELPATGPEPELRARLAEHLGIEVEEAGPEEEPLLTYRARQALYGKHGVIPAGGLFLAKPSSAKARSSFAELVEAEAEEIPAEAAAALAAAAES